MRKIFGTIVLILCLGAFVFAADVAADEILLANSFRNLVNEYWIHWNAGGEHAAKGLGSQYLSLSADNNEAKQMSDIERAMARGVNGIAIMPATAGALGSMVELCESQNVWVVSMWDRPSALVPQDYKHWVAHITMDTVKQGYVPAKILFEALGGKGRIVAIGGLPGTGSAEDRHQGLKNALEEFPGVELLGYQSGDYNRVKGVKVMEDFLSAHGDEIDGIWCANDDMAVGALEVLKSSGLAGGKIKLVGVDAIKEAVKAIQDGDMFATVSGDPWSMSGLGMVYVYNAVNGKMVPEEDQIVLLDAPIVDHSNAAEYFQSNFAGERSADWQKIAEEVSAGMVATPK
jgi:ribose transport system substrate-binding protein